MMNSFQEANWICKRLFFSSSSIYMPTSTISDIKSSLERHNDTFETLLKLIPAKYYIVQELTEEQVC